MTPCILIIDDDEELVRILQLDLKRSGYEVITARNGLEGLRVFQNNQTDLVLLDIALPLMDGMNVCQRIRELSDVPVMMMTAHAVTEDDIAEGLNLGADEYMLKPLRNLEFHARLKALLRRAKITDPEPHAEEGYSDPYLSVDINSRRVRVGGQDLRLTPTEFKLLATFVRNPGVVLTFQHLLERVWGFEYKNEHHYPRIYVSHLRRKIEPDAKNPTYIHNEYGIGYRFVGQFSSGD